MGCRFAMAAMAIVSATAGPNTGARAQDIAMPCDAFIRNADGSWTAMRDVPVSGMGRKLVLRQGSELRPGAAILSVDFAALLEEQKAAAGPALGIVGPSTDLPLAPVGVLGGAAVTLPEESAGAVRTAVG